MITWLMKLVAPDVNRVGPYLYFVPQLVIGIALLISYDIALWAVDRFLLHRQHEPRTSFPHLLLDYVVFFEVAGWLTVFGRHPWALLVAIPPSLFLFLLVRVLPAAVAAHRASPDAGWRRAWRSVLGPGGRILTIAAAVVVALWLFLWIAETVAPAACEVP